ncbi:MAG TPA: NADH-quinone oxidoreductase subunit A, partial [Candidatus Acidoferrales bacterium]|nr:NADH-quinone oxidoreductase subunit A [Candidatus Acidoferrales bacterium]
MVAFTHRPTMPPAYIPLLLFSLLVLSFPVVTLIVFKYIRPGSRGGPAKFQPYKCGILPETSARGRNSARFY